MLNDNQRRIVEGIRRSGNIIIVANTDRASLELKIADKEFCHDVAIAVQKYYNAKNNRKDA